MPVRSEDGGVQWLDVTEGIFVAVTSIEVLGLDGGHEQKSI